jgi:chromosome segregation ATPase
VFAGEARDLKPDLVTDSGLGIQSPSSDTTVDPSLGGGDQLETALQIAMPSQVGPSKPSTGAPVLNRDNLDTSDVGLEETELSLAISNHSESSSCSDGGLEESRLSTGAEADVRSNVTLLSEAAGQNEGTVLSLRIRVQELETQLQDQKEWAQQKVMQAARRLSKDLAELKSLRQAKDEILQLKKDQKALEDSTMKKLSEMESALKKASGQVDRANAAVRRLENENAELRAEMEAAKLNAAESMAKCQEIAKQEKKSLKRAQALERQKSKLQEDLSEERRKLTQIQQQLA